jgi:orotidine-5'-phosphate decarboxylase
MATFVERLHSSQSRCGNGICVGIDPRWDQLPEAIKARAQSRAANPLEAAALAFEEFSLRIIDLVAGKVPVVKPQVAFFEELGPAGSVVLGRVIRAARRAGLLVICDAKRGDIGTTAEAYARGYLAGEDPDAAPWGADALTVSPYLGRDTLEPFLQVANERGGGLYVLVRTSNPGAASFQDPASDGIKLFERVADAVEAANVPHLAGGEYGPMGAVVGATYPQELVQLRARMPHAPILVPGYGAQGGTADDVAAAFDANGLGAVVNSSRGIIFAYRRKDLALQFQGDQWEQAIPVAVEEMRVDLARALAARKS